MNPSVTSDLGPLSSESDPMLSSDESKRDAYRSNVMDVVRQTIEEDRAARRSQKPTDESPAVLVGSTGMARGLNRAL